MSYLLRRFLAFGPNDGCYGHIHGIVCSNVLILYTNMHLVSTDNVDEESFPFHWTKKPFSIFRVWKMSFFAKHQPQICCKTWEIHFLKTLDHVICTNNQIVSSKKVSIHLFWKNTSFCRLRWKRVKFELQVPRSLLMIFGKNHFLGTELPISSQIHQEFLNIQPLATNRRARRLDFFLKSASKILKNPEKFKMM